jgi:hypothetical protein
VSHPAPGRPNTRPEVLHQDIEDASARHIAVAKRLAATLINSGFDRHNVQAVLQHVRAFIDVHFDNTHEGRKRNA